MPVALLQGREIHIGTVRREGEAIAAAGVGFFPEDFFGEDVEALEFLERCDVEAAGFGVGGDAFDVGRCAVGGQSLSGDAFYEFVIVIDVKNRDAVAAIIEIIADAGCRHV